MKNSSKTDITATARPDISNNPNFMKRAAQQALQAAKLVEAQRQKNGARYVRTDNKT